MNLFTGLAWFSWLRMLGSLYWHCWSIVDWTRTATRRCWQSSHCWRSCRCWRSWHLTVDGVDAVDRVVAVDGVDTVDGWRSMTEFTLLTADGVVTSWLCWQSCHCWRLKEFTLLTVDGVVTSKLTRVAGVDGVLLLCIDQSNWNPLRDCSMSARVRGKYGWNLWVQKLHGFLIVSRSQTMVWLSRLVSWHNYIIRVS